MNAKLSILAIIVIAATAQVASAQYYQPQHHYGAYPVQYPAAYNGYGNYHHASTLEEGMANGIANLIHSAGAANLLHSQAARNYQEAHSRYLDNRVKATSTFFEMRKINRESVAAERGPRITAEAMTRIAKDRAPERLAASDLDMLSGRINWPAVLEADQFQSERERLDELVLKWARYKGLGADEHLELQVLAKNMQTELKRHIRSLPPAEYVKAKNVLESLPLEIVKREEALAKGTGEAARFVADSR
jgi:hypothetical protein